MRNTCCYIITSIRNTRRRSVSRHYKMSFLPDKCMHTWPFTHQAESRMHDTLKLYYIGMRVWYSFLFNSLCPRNKIPTFESCPLRTAWQLKRQVDHASSRVVLAPPLNYQGRAIFGCSVSGLNELKARRRTCVHKLILFPSWYATSRENKKILVYCEQINLV